MFLGPWQILVLLVALTGALLVAGLVLFAAHKAGQLQSKAIDKTQGEK